MTELNNASIDLWQHAETLGFGDLHLKFDPATGMRAVIAIHSTRLGPALGGCRFTYYETVNDAIFDALRLAQGMSYKAAISGLKLGGGKAVIMRPDTELDRTELFCSFGRFVDELGGRYVTAVDSGTAVEDMDIIATATHYVASTSASAIATGDPSPYTAYGVKRGIEAAAHSKLGRHTLQGMHIAIQGVGQVGYYLAKLLYANGAKLTVCDVSDEALARVVTECHADVVAPQAIYRVNCDVFAPCALGGVLNQTSVAQLNAAIVAGAANNQLSEPNIANMLQRRDILYAPDFVINAGGLVQIAIRDDAATYKKLDTIYATLVDIFERASTSGENTAAVAETRAKEIIAAGP